MFGIDPVTGPHRPPGRHRRARAAPSRWSAARSTAPATCSTRHAKVLEFDANDGPALARRRPAAARRAVERGRRGLRRPAGRRVGHRRRTASSGCSSPARSPPRSAACPPGPIYGPGPVAETFPEPLTELERDLWVPPLREAVQEAVLLAGAATPADVDASEVVVAVDGHVAIDLRLAGEIRPSGRVGQQAQPGPGRPPPAGRLAGRPAAGGPARAWPSTCSTASTPTSRPCRALADLTSRQLIALLHRSQDDPAGAARPRDPHGHAHRHRATTA